MSAVYEVLVDAFARSEYMSRPGGGDEQAIAEALYDVAGLWDEIKTQVDGDAESALVFVVAGVIAARALVRVQDVLDLAETLTEEILERVES